MSGLDFFGRRCPSFWLLFNISHKGVLQFPSRCKKESTQNCILNPEGDCTYLSLGLFPQPKRYHTTHTQTRAHTHMQTHPHTQRHTHTHTNPHTHTHHKQQNITRHNRTQHSNTHNRTQHSTRPYTHTPPDELSSKLSS